MTTPQQFNCVLCKESFQSKDELQTHFRKHGDPKFNQGVKDKSKVQNMSSDEKQNEGAEMVGCDVCTEMFPTISKAITHKHKKHPEHDAKYFCPWCGKLFTLKHLYNKHLQSNHKELERQDDINFHCDMCSNDFYVPSAMLYHNKFFHRQDTDLPMIGQSKKLKMVNQDILQIYYCSFCGDEYDNKVNLHKHTLDDHEDENQSPEDVLRCPLCEAVFYHLDAYEVHLTFHSTDDLYSETNELFEQITEYSLETVPPIMEKVENAEPQDAESAMNAIGLDKFLEMAMDPSMDSEKDGENPKKSKKHKKHKKSKKSAITLDEFLNMNKDVFGEGIDFQGVEEVPTKVIAKNLKQKKVDKANLKMLKGSDLDKLKKQGIIVKMKPNKKPVNAVRVGCKIPSKNAQLPQQPISSIATSQTKTPDEVLSKFLSQGNSQIKIVKKSSSETADKSSHEKPTLPLDSENLRGCQTPEKLEVECEVPQSGCTSSETEAKDEHVTQKTSTDLKNEIKNTTINSTIFKTQVSPQVPVEADTVPNEKCLSSKTEISNDEDGDEGVNNEAVTEIKAKSNLKQGIPNISEDNDDGSTIEQSKLSSSTTINTPTKSSLDAIKHLSHLIVKSVLNSKTSPKPTDDSEENHAELTDAEDHSGQNKDDDSFDDNDMVEKLKPTESKEPTKSFEVLKTLSKNITVKPMSPSPKSETKLYPVKNMVSSVVGHNTTTKSMATSNSLDMCPKHSANFKEIDETSPIISEKLEKQNVNANLLKNLTNITAKPINKSIQGPVSKNSSNNMPIVNKIYKTPCEVKKNEIDQEIEIFNIEDSDSDEAEKCNTTAQEVNISKTVAIKQAPNESLEKIKSIKNITLKSTSQQKTMVNKSTVNRIPGLKESLQSNDQCSMSDFSDEDDQDMMMPANLSINQKLSLQSSNMSPNIQALKNLGKHITVKSRNSSPSVSIKSNKDGNFFHGSRAANDADSDNDSLPGKVKISEINEEHFSDDDMGDEKEINRQYDTNPSVQSPDASNSDHDENFNEDTDGEMDGVESHIQKNTLKRTIDMAQNTLDIKNLNKNLTIKPISKNNKDVQPSPSKNSSAVPISANRELSIKPYKQIKPDVVRDSSNGNSNNPTNIVRATNQVMNQNSVSNNQVNTVNKEVTVKTFQTKTVIEEITTTVTKTIKTVNQTVKHQAQSSSSNVQAVKYQKVQGMKPNNPTVKNFQGVTVRQASPAAGTRVRGLVPTRPANATNVRPSNQLVPVRSSVNPVRTVAPRMPVVKKAPNQSGPNIGKPIRMAPNVMTTSKRVSEDNIGHFSCFKKPKESLIPISDLPNFEGEQMSSTVQYSASQKNFSSATKTVKGNTVYSSTQMRAESSSCSQQLNKLNNLSGLKIVKTSQNKQTMHVEEKSVNASQRNTLEAIEKLQKQGLLIKKPRVEVTEEDDPSGDENDQYLTEEPDD